MAERVSDELAVHNVDLHYHAGQEREPGCTLEDHLQHAQMTGRRIIGVTDHSEYFIGGEVLQEGTYPYEFSLAGLECFHDEVRRASLLFPELRVLFGPELSMHQDLSEVPNRVAEISDFFPCEAPDVSDDHPSNTDQYTARVGEIRRLMDRCGIPAFLAHPFRSAIDARLVFSPIAPGMAAMDARPEFDFPDDELNRFFMLDVRALARQCASHAVPIEVNGQALLRVILLNLPVLSDLFCGAHRIMCQEGVELVPGSDQHEFRTGFGGRGGCHVPWQVFERLGVGLPDMPLARRLAGRA